MKQFSEKNTHLGTLILDTASVNWKKAIGIYCLSILMLGAASFLVAAIVLMVTDNYGMDIVLLIVFGGMTPMFGLMVFPVFVIWKLSFYQVTLYERGLVAKRRSKEIGLSFDEVERITSSLFSLHTPAAQLMTVTIAKKDGSKPLSIRLTDFKTSSQALEMAFKSFQESKESSSEFYDHR